MRYLIEALYQCYWTLRFAWLTRGWHPGPSKVNKDPLFNRRTHTTALSDWPTLAAQYSVLALRIEVTPPVCKWPDLMTQGVGGPVFWWPSLHTQDLDIPISYTREVYDMLFQARSVRPKGLFCGPVDIASQSCDGHGPKTVRPRKLSPDNHSVAHESEFICPTRLLSWPTFVAAFFLTQARHCKPLREYEAARYLIDARRALKGKLPKFHSLPQLLVDPETYEPLDKEARRHLALALKDKPSKRHTRYRLLAPGPRPDTTPAPVFEMTSPIDEPVT